MWLVVLAWQRAVKAALRPHELTHVQFVLLASAWWLSKQGDPPTQRELAEHAGTDQMMVSQVLRRLEAKGLVERTVDEFDTRGKRVRLTRAGRASLDKALPAVDQTDADFFSSVSRPQLLGVLACLAHNNDRGPRRAPPP